MKYLSESQLSSAIMFSKLFVTSNLCLDLMLTDDNYYHQTLKNRLTGLCNNQISCFLNVISLKTIYIPANALHHNCLASKDIILELFSLSSKAVVNNTLAMLQSQYMVVNFPLLDFLKYFELKLSNCKNFCLTHSLTPCLPACLPAHTNRPT